MNDIASLARQEAEERSELLTVERYDIDLDLRGLLEGDTLESTSTVTFDCRRPRSSTFVDCVMDIQEATLNGRPLDLDAHERGRLVLPDLAEHNVLVVRATQSDTANSNGVLRTVDPSDKLVYVWTSFEPDDARRLWACFDQPDLKAVHRFTVHAPDPWTVTSNLGPDEVSEAATGGRTWHFPDTPRLSTYVVVVNAGPFHEIREERGGHSLGLYCRQSLRAYLERDAEELLGLTEAGLAFFGERFDQPFPQQRYDQVFVPNMGGAMENWGCVTWSDTVLFRSPPTHGQRSLVASVLLHEMAHMWFGDLVTMRWWDDLWLNEAFASWAATWASVDATRYTESWAAFLAGLKIEGYRVDMGPASHPIRSEVPDVAQAMANFDAITYVKGESTLKQLVAYVGEEAFVEGLRAYFRDHAWGNTRLADLMEAVGTAAGRDLSGWTTDWFDRAGTDTLTLTDDAVLATAPDDGAPRPHRVDIGSYRDEGDGLVRVGRTPVEVSGARTPLPDALPAADLHLLNDGDLTFAAVRSDDASLETMLERAGDLPEPISRALAVATAWDMLVKGELSADQVITCLVGVLEHEREPGVVEPFLALGQRAADLWSPVPAIGDHRARLAACAVRLADEPDHRSPALRTLAACAGTEEDFATLAGPAQQDHDLAWRVLVRRAARDEHDPDSVEALLQRDPDPDASARALAVTAARPDADAKEEVWAEVFENRSVPPGSPLAAVAQAFWRPAQHDLVRPYADRYLQEATRLAGGGMLAVGGLLRFMFPTLGDGAFVDACRSAAERPEQDPTVRATLLTGSDTLTRMLRARDAR